MSKSPDRKALIRLASGHPKGSPERREILRHIVGASFRYKTELSVSSVALSDLARKIWMYLHWEGVFPGSSWESPPVTSRSYLPAVDELFKHELSKALGSSQSFERIIRQAVESTIKNFKL